ncbi:Serine/threonine-protein kinase Tel1 [Favolaschia claudopus]|uniref:Serine/threonine-protein kinase Tel1 n=1 Tax=Favolaschia claudopus TaxID=2862362 RepID=A0AAW0BGG0_9AGAR
MANRSVSSITKQIASSKVTDRQQGITSLREVFSQDHVVSHFHFISDGPNVKVNPMAWLPVFQSLFEAVREERDQLTKSSGAIAARRRLANVASTVRWLTERTLDHQNNGVFDAIFDHLCSAIPNKGGREICEPIALDYIKTLRCLLEHPPHLEFMDEDRWEVLAQLAFSAVLDDNLKTKFERDSEDDAVTSPPPSVPAESDTDEYYAKDDQNGSPSKKRLRKATNPPAKSPPPLSGRPKRSKVPSKEQNEFVHILSILLRSHSAPLLLSNKPYLASSILRRLQRVLEVYPADASLYHDFLSMVLSTLSHLALNRNHLVVRFAQKNWDNLIGLWGTKNKGMKECLVAILRTLFPFLIAKEKGVQIPYDWSSQIAGLWRLLDGEAESRWGVVGLSLESLRLEIFDPEAEDGGAFVAQTFRAGNDFDAAQALAWAILELQSDCAEKVFEHYESVHSSPVTDSAPVENKRRRIENPLTTLIDSIRENRQSHVRAYHLQTLLFFIDRHWHVVHETIQQTLFSALIQFIATDDPLVQSWTFACFAAIAHADTRARSVASAPRARDWDTIWTHAIRRTNVPGASRAACHAAYVLLLHSHSNFHASSRLSLSPQRVLLEIESFVKDIDVQGPPSPHDSVCAVLSQMLRIASQDARLYRMQFEEKVLSWVMDSWTARDAGNAPLHLVKDILLLLETICSVSKRSDLFCRVLMPDCLIVDTLVEEGRTKVVRDYVLNATLPEFRKPDSLHSSTTLDLPTTADDRRVGDDPVEEGPRERKISTFLLRSLEALTSDFQALATSAARLTAEKARRSLDWVVVALAFESVLRLNGTRPNRRVIQAACKLLLLVTPLLKDSKWTHSEKAFILLALEPLVFTWPAEDEGEFSIAMLPPDAGSGIKAETLQSLTTTQGRKGDIVVRRRDLQRIVCKSTDVQDTFETVSKTLREVLQILLRLNKEQNRAMDMDFEATVVEHAQDTTSTSAVRCLIEVSVCFLTNTPILRSISGESTNDKELTAIVTKCTEQDPTETSLLLIRTFVRHVQQRTLTLNLNNFGTLMRNLGETLVTYYYARNEGMQIAMLHYLQSTLHIWCSLPQEHQTRADVRKLCTHFSRTLKAAGKNRTELRSWKARDSYLTCFTKFLLQDPSELSGFDAEKFPKFLPTNVLPKMNRDDDIRVRFRAGILNSQLFTVGRATGRKPSDVYTSIWDAYPTDLAQYENMLTRLLSLGNMVVVSSAIRRGAYWHLIEGSLLDKNKIYTAHCEAILRSVSQRLGLPRFSILFEAYAAQIAFTIKTHKQDFLKFPPELLGYSDLKDCAEANFLAFTPTNLVAQGNSEFGRKLFTAHCTQLQKSVAQGVRTCFPDIVGYQLLLALDSIDADQSLPFDMVESVLLEKTMMKDDSAGFRTVLGESVDGVVGWIVRTLGDHDFQPDGSIVEALEVVDSTGKTADTFRALVRYRRVGDFEPHSPNIPAFFAPMVLDALTWFETFVPDTDASATAYHVIHELFADIQRSPLVNEQLRLLNALCLFISFRHEDFQTPALLHALLRGATSLLAQADLATTAQSILEWVFDCYRTTRADNPRFPDVLIRICCCANDYARKGPNSSFYSLGADLRTWIDGQVLMLSTVKSKTMQASLTRALSAWPHTPSPQLAELFTSITSSDLSAVLSDRSIISNKFRLVRQLRDHALAADRDDERFAETDFWRLRESIPSSEQLQEQDIDAFAALLEMYEGRISSFDREQQRSVGRQRRDTSSGASPQNWIIQVLLSMLEASDGSQVHLAYQTLRSLMSVCPPDPFAHVSYEYRDELRYLEAYKRVPKTRPVRSLEELTTSDVYLDITGDFPRWIGAVSTLLSDILSAGDPFYAQLTLIFQSEPTFTEQTLPVLVHSILESERTDAGWKASLTTLPCRTTLSAYFTAVLESGCAAIPVVRTIVDIVLYLRNFTPEISKQADSAKFDALSYDKWLAIDYTLLARNSMSCGLYTTSLLFLELAADYSASSPGTDAATAPILYEIYSHIDEPDGFYGIKTQNLHQFLIKRFHHERQWDKAFRFHSAALEAGSTDSAEADGLLQSFHSFGFNHLAIDTMKSSSLNVGSTSGMNYRLGWRTETWDLPERHGEGNPGAPLYNALRAVYRTRNSRAVQSVARGAICEEMGRLRILGSENVAEIRDAAQSLMCLHQVSHWFTPDIQNRLVTHQSALTDWKEHIDLGSGFEFSDFENVMATRISLVRSARRKEERSQIGEMVSPFCQCLIDVEKQCLIKLSQAARKAQQFQIALNSVVRAQKLERTPSLDVSAEFASVLRLHKEEKLAVEFLKGLDLTHLPPAEKAVLLARLGTWIAEARLENPTDIAKNYFEPATSSVNSLRGKGAAKSVTTFSASHARVFHQYAKFSEHQYKAIKNSPDALRWKVYVERKTAEVEYRKTQGDVSTNPRLREAKVLLQTDQDLYNNHMKAGETFLARAIEMYSRALEASDAFDGDGAIRLVSLWSENFDKADPKFQDKVREALDRVPSRKLVFLAHQLVARLSKTPEPVKNQSTLQSVVLRMCKDHPFHSLYQLYALLPNDPPVQERRQSGRQTTLGNTPSPSLQAAARSTAASEIFDRLRADSKSVQRIKDVERVAGACLEWAKFKIINTALDPRRKTVKGQPPKPPEIPPGLAIHKLVSVNVPVLTHPPALDPSLVYDNCVFINKYEPTFTTSGGINLPKVCMCIGSDGGRYKQLFKGEGNDDLRQDAVMEQVFTLVNTVLQSDKETSRRKLHVRGYMIIPLGSQAGILEFVINTTPLNSWVPTAHDKYNKNDMTHKVASEKIRTAQQTENLEPEKLLQKYLEIKKKFRPVMRHFFTEKHKNPMAWFAMRLNYIRSVATTSIVGHVLGLGDRHQSNILLDAETGEMVHIDLGIAFDQGKLLKVPEQVPFRMTSDVVDGMGPAGTGGVFQRCAEETLRVLREGSEVIMTVLEVFKHDPLHSWTASEFKMKNVQKDANIAEAGAGGTKLNTWGTGIGIDMASGSADEAADRALTGVARKLDKSMSVEYTVNELLAEATDPMRLATIFYGWGAIF